MELVIAITALFGFLSVIFIVLNKSKDKRLEE
jgi:hypothetical protein